MLPEAARVRHSAFLMSRQTDCGGFCGRDVDLNGNPLFEDGSQPDLYYTSFALRGLHGIDKLSGEVAEKVGTFLKSPGAQPRSIVDLISWLSSAFLFQISTGTDLLSDAPAGWPELLAVQFERCRTADGGYAKSFAGASGSTYHSFLIACCYELIAQPIPQPELLKRFVLERQRDDGGFVEIAPMRSSGTNPTAAAVALLQIVGGMDSTVVDGIARFLEEVRGDDGGFQANTRIPFSDLLSTFTGYLTALEIGKPELLPPAKLQRFLDALEVPEGGYLAAGWDHSPDVEYSFYGLGTQALLLEMQSKL
ncbi:prenyltransferase/squalene oxidase repeat-containing protein [Planctomicrobium sp. SH668]|uniref:prenyltransferase/squalene oxidase repeat-containing protein n=1 Tax=Planctomicrobium sp. SH668 TaxID=3448126 RepID=UPI003F5C8F77